MRHISDIVSFHILCDSPLAVILTVLRILTANALARSVDGGDDDDDGGGGDDNVAEGKEGDV